MAMEKPIISTKIGAEGINYDAGRNIIIADSPAEFAKEVLRIYVDSNFRTSPWQRG